MSYRSLAGRAGVGAGAAAIVGRGRATTGGSGPLDQHRLRFARPCGVGVSAPAPSRTNARSTTSRWPSAAVVRAASSRASTRWRCCCCGPVARSPRVRRRRLPRRGSPSGWPLRKRQRLQRLPASPNLLHHRLIRTGEAAGAYPLAPTHLSRAQQDPRRSHRPHGGRACRARPLARRPVAHRPRRSIAGELQDMGWVGRAADRRPGRRVGQPCASPRRAGRCASRLALAGLGRTGCAAPAGDVGPASRHVASGPLADSVAATIGWQVRQADVLAGVPMTDHWIVMGRSDTREDRIEVRRIWLRGATIGRVGDGVVVRRLPADPRHVVRSSARRCMPTCSAIPAPWRCAFWSGPRHGDAATCPADRRLVDRRGAAPRLVGRSLPSRGSSDIRCASMLLRHVRGGRWLLTDSTGSLPLVDGATCRHVAGVQRGSTGDGDGRVDAGRPRAADRSPRRPRRRHRARRRLVVREGDHDRAGYCTTSHDVDARRLLAGDGHRRAARHRPARPTRATDGRPGRPGRRRSAADAIAAAAATGRRVRGGAACRCAAGRAARG